MELHDLMTTLGYTAAVPGKHYHRAVGNREIYIRVEMRTKSLFYGSTHPMRVFGNQGLRAFWDAESMKRIITAINNQFEKCPH
jgi:hypothetical protein